MHEYVPTQYREQNASQQLCRCIVTHEDPSFGESTHEASISKTPHGFKRTTPALIIDIAFGSIVTNKRASATPKGRTDRMLGVHVEVACDFEHATPSDGQESMCERNVFCR